MIGGRGGHDGMERVTGSRTTAHGVVSAPLRRSAEVYSCIRRRFQNNKLKKTKGTVAPEGSAAHEPATATDPSSHRQSALSAPHSCVPPPPPPTPLPMPPFCFWLAAAVSPADRCSGMRGQANSKEHGSGSAEWSAAVLCSTGRRPFDSRPRTTVHSAGARRRSFSFREIRPAA
jgi:hypothetical protein